MDRKNLNEMLLSIIIPCYNESDTIVKLLDKIKCLDLPVKKEIIVVDDGSTDKSIRLLQGISGLRVFRHEKNLGKGHALKTGLKNVLGDLILIQDADMEYNPEDYLEIIKTYLMDPGVAVYGSRFMSLEYVEKNIFYWGNKFLSLVFSIVFFKHITDVETCYKLFERKVVDDWVVKSNSFSIEIELSARLIKQGVRIVEVPISYSPRTRSDGKKIGVWDGFEAFFSIFYYRFFD